MLMVLVINANLNYFVKKNDQKLHFLEKGKESFSKYFQAFFGTQIYIVKIKPHLVLFF